MVACEFGPRHPKTPYGVPSPIPRFRDSGILLAFPTVETVGLDMSALHHPTKRKIAFRGDPGCRASNLGI